jgi:enterochelin esterase-like enzyme
VLEPQGALFFVLLVAAFAGLVTWLARTRLVVVRVLTAFLAFLPAAVFGIAVVNKYYDYYQTWGALFSDVTGSGGQSVPQLAVPSEAAKAGSFESVLAASAATPLAEQTGYLFQVTVTGPASHLARQVYVYLPPQYFQSAYKTTRFPAIELLHGSPGMPESWLDVINVTTIYDGLLDSGLAKPAVLVMPDTDGGEQYALQCLNIPHGPQDMTFVGQEVPNWVARNLRVMPPGRAWGIAGYSEGAYCAANIGLQDSTRFGYVGSLSGYFAPSSGQIPAGGQPGGAPVTVANVFAGDPRLGALNTPYKYVLRIPVRVPVPDFWLAVGRSSRWDLQAAAAFRQYAQFRDPHIPLLVISGGGHSANVWRASIGPMLQWMTPRLAESARTVEEIAQHNKALRARKGASAKTPAMVNGTATGHPLPPGF